jgi:nucleotide-binding universal stress UspA family protein
MYRNILIATDGSALAEHAVSHGLSLAKSLGAKVTALIVEAPFNVFDVPESRIRKMSEAYAQHAEETKKHAARILERVADAVRQRGSPVKPCSSSMTNRIKGSSRLQRTKVAMSSSWPRTGGAGSPRFCSGA